MADVDPPERRPVVVAWEELRDGAIDLAVLEDAFGADSLGILLVKGVPAAYASLRRQVLGAASHLAHLPPSTLGKLENPAAKYLTGWSLGKESLVDGQLDTLKGSYYANCAFYVDPTLEMPTEAPGFTPETCPDLHPNLWPSEHDLPEFEIKTKALCRIIIDTAVLVARACDRFATARIDGYRPGYLEHVVKTSTTTKARLLHYFPTPAASQMSATPMDWCASHLDHSCLTGLTSAMFIDEDANARELHARSRDAAGGLAPMTEIPSPDAAARLYIESRGGETVHVKIPKDCIAFQTGEALQIITKGRFKAVPHHVRGVKALQGSSAQVARNTLAVFIQPNLGEIIDEDSGLTFGRFAASTVDKNTVVQDKS